MHDFGTKFTRDKQKLLFQVWDSSLNHHKISLNGTTHVWCASFSRLIKNIDVFRTTLSLTENIRASKFVNKFDREQAIVARGLLRTIMAKYLNISPLDIEFTYEKFGKPIISIDTCVDAPTFSMSHSGDFFLLAVAAPGSIIGIDVEQHRDIQELLQIANHYFHVNEMKELATLPLLARRVAFFDCWTRKESIAKALGLGIAMPLRNFGVSLLPGVSPKLLFWLLRENEVKHWSMQELQLPAIGYSATVAARGIHLHDAQCWHYVIS